MVNCRLYMLMPHFKSCFCPPHPPQPCTLTVGTAPSPHLVEPVLKRSMRREAAVCLPPGTLDSFSVKLRTLALSSEITLGCRELPGAGFLLTEGEPWYTCVCFLGEGGPAPPGTPRAPSLMAIPVLRPGIGCGRVGRALFCPCRSGLRCAL